MSQRITKYLTIKLDKETKNWNKAVSEGRHDFFYELCEDEYIKSLLSDYQETKVQRSIDSFVDSIDELRDDIENIEYTLNDIKTELESLKRVAEKDND